MDSLGDRGSAVFIDPNGDLRVEHQATREFDGGALLMLPLLGQTYQDVADGRLQWTDSLIVDQSHIVPGTGILQLHEGSRATVRDLVRLTAYHSDNTAANYLIDRVGLDRVNSYAQSLQLLNTRLGRKFNTPNPPTDAERKRTTASDMGRFLTLLLRGQIVSPQASQELLDLLKVRGRIDPFWVGTLLNDDTELAHMTGRLPGERADAAYVSIGRGRGYVLVVSVEGPDQQNETPDDSRAMQGQIADVSKRIFDAVRAAAGP